jgi:hypothetical protein
MIRAPHSVFAELSTHECRMALGEADEVRRRKRTLRGAIGFFRLSQRKIWATCAPRHDGDICDSGCPAAVRIANVQLYKVRQMLTARAPLSNLGEGKQVMITQSTTELTR